MASLWDIFAQRLSDWDYNVSRGQRDLYGTELTPNPRTQGELDQEQRLREVVQNAMSASDRDRSADSEAGLLSFLVNPSGDTSAFVNARERLAKEGTSVPGLDPYSQNVGDYVASEADSESPFFRLLGNNAPTPSFREKIASMRDILDRKGFSRAAEGSSRRHDRNLGIPVSDEMSLDEAAPLGREAFAQIFQSKDVAKIGALYTLLKAASQTGMPRSRLIEMMKYLAQTDK